MIKVAKLYLPKMASGFYSDKMKLIIGDGFEFLKNNENTFDVIITDSSGLFHYIDRDFIDLE